MEEQFEVLELDLLVIYFQHFTLSIAVNRLTRFRELRVYESGSREK